MIDITGKSSSLRSAQASGKIMMQETTLQKVLRKEISKGDVFEIARACGIRAAKETANWVLFCHNIPLDWVEISFTTICLLRFGIKYFSAILIKKSPHRSFSSWYLL